MLETEPQIIDAYVTSGKAKIIYRHLLQLGDRTERAAEASECAADQGKFWEMRHLLYERQDELYSANDLDGLLASMAGDLSLEQQPFTTCLNNNTHQDAVQADNNAARAAGVQSRPVFLIGNQRLVGARPFEEFEQVLNNQ